jgi:hypothetical protein
VRLVPDNFSALTQDLASQLAAEQGGVDVVYANAGISVRAQFHRSRLAAGGLPA